MRALVVYVVAACSLLLSGCSTIEHRSEAVPKKALAPLKNQQELKLVWTTNKGKGTGKNDAKLRLAVTGSAVVSANISGVVTAQDAESGRLLWSYDCKTFISGGPTVIEDHVLVGTRDKGLIALAMKNGQLIWQKPMSGEVLATPRGHKGMVFVHSLDGSLAALKLSDGSLVWRHGLMTPPIVLRHSSSPALSNHHVLVGFANGRLLALHQNDGSQSWEREVAIPRGRSDIQRMTDISADPVVADGVVYVVSYQGRLAALKLDSGLPLWERECSSYAGFSLTKSALFVSEAKGSVFAIDRKTGKILWEQNALQGRRLSKPTVFGNTIVVGDDDGFIHSLAIQDGSLLSRVMVDSKGIEAPPVVEHNRLHVLGKGGKLAVYRQGA